MSQISRTRQRELLLKAIYLYEIRKSKVSQEDFEELYVQDLKWTGGKETLEVAFVQEMLETFIEQRKHLVQVLSSLLSGEKKISHLNYIDKAILYIGIMELKYTDLDSKIIINSAIDLADKFSTVDSFRLINAVLDTANTRMRKEEN